jgi:hypothetical protein
MLVTRTDNLLSQRHLNQAVSLLLDRLQLKVVNFTELEQTPFLSPRRRQKQQAKMKRG